MKLAGEGNQRATILVSHPRHVKQLLAGCLQWHFECRTRMTSAAVFKRQVTAESLCAIVATDATLAARRRKVFRRGG